MYNNAAPLFMKQQVKLYAFATGRVVGDFEPEFIKQGIKVWHEPLPNYKKPIELIKYIFQTIAFIKNNQIDLIHIHRSNAKWLFSFVAKLAGISCLYTVHNVFKNRKTTWIKAYLERWSARVCFGLQFQSIGQSVYENELYYYRTPTIRINNWFDNGKFYPAVSPEEKELLRQKLGIPKDKFVLISTGGCSVVKNHHAILNAIALLPNKDNIIYLHLGCGATEQEERVLASQLDIADRVFFLGNKVNVRDYLVSSDLYLMTSLFEGLGNAALEAMACGIPSILYNSPGLRDLIQNDDKGLLIEQNIDKLCESIDWMRTHVLQATLKAEKALRAVNDEFSMEKNVNQIIKLYLSLMK